MKINPFIIIIYLGLFYFCNEPSAKADLKSDYIIFGHFYGFCQGENCIEIFKLTESKLYEDVADNYPTSTHPYEGNFTEMDNEKLQLIKALADNIPQELLSEQDTVIGSPDAADGGGIYIAIKNDDGTRFWLIDQMKFNVPDYLHSFMDEINNSISLISD